MKEDTGFNQAGKDFYGKTWPYVKTIMVIMLLWIGYIYLSE